MTENIRAYYEEHKTVFNENFHQVLASFDMEAIHKMRTSTKRLRALFILLKFLSEEKFNEKEQLKKIRSLFKYGGNIREIQIEKQLVLTYQEILQSNFSEYTEYLSQREHKEIAKFLKHLPAFSEREHILNDAMINATIDKLFPEKLPNQAKQFIEEKKSAIFKLIGKPNSNHRIHAVRIQLKQVYYLFEILASLVESRTLLGLENERLREMEQYLGEWHDLVNSPVYMNAFFKTNKYTGDKKYLSLKKRIAEDRKKMRTEIIQKIYPELQVHQTAK